MTNRVLKRTVFHISARLCSPLCVSNGEGVLTDQDVIRDYDDVPFIPGASLAGAMRAYLGREGNEKCIFGFVDPGQNRGEMSSVFVSDFVFTSQPVSRIRDGVALSAQKTALTGAKFDMEVIDTGAEGAFYLELVVREKDSEEEMHRQLRRIFYGLGRHEIRLGAKKTRGYGELEVLSIKGRDYTAENILEYGGAWEPQAELPDITHEWMGQECGQRPGYLTVEVPLRLTGGISIRQYGARKKEPDFVHVTSGQGSEKRAVIPGTSFAGAIRHRMRDMLTELGESAADIGTILDGMWGCVKAEQNHGPSSGQPAAHRSCIVIDECILEDSVPLTMVRNGISRFESSARDGALFKERSYVGGTTTLTIRIRRQEQGQEREMLRLLLPVLQDIRNGYLPAGGQSAVGRGIFEGNGRIRIDGEEWEEEYA